MMHGQQNVKFRIENVPSIRHGSVLPSHFVKNIQNVQQFSLKCPQAGRNNYLRRQHHWLLLAMTDHTGNAQTTDDDPLVTALRSLTFPVDSHVTLAYRGSAVDQVVLQELYNIGKGQPLVFTAPLAWSPGQVLPPKLKRDNYGGVPIKATSVASSRIFWYSNCTNCRSEWPRGPRRRSTAARPLRLCARIPPGGMDVCLL